MLYRASCYLNSLVLPKLEYYFNSLKFRAFAVLLPSASWTQCQVYSSYQCLLYQESDLITKFSWHAFCPVNYHNYKLNHKTGQKWMLFQLTGDQGFCCVASISFLNTVSSLLQRTYIAIWEFTRVLTWHQTFHNLILFCLIHSQKK